MSEAFVKRIVKDCAEANTFGDGIDRFEFEKRMGYGDIIARQAMFARDPVTPREYKNKLMQYAWIGWNYKVWHLRDMLKEEGENQ